MNKIVEEPVVEETTTDDTPIVEETDSSQGDQNEFETFLADSDETDGDEFEIDAQAEEAVVVEEPAKEVKEEAAAVSDEAPVETTVADAAKTETEEEPKPEETVVETPEVVAELETVNPEEQRLQLQQFTQQAETLLAEQVYQMTDEQITAFEDDPGKMLPQFAARVHMQAMQATTVQVSRLLPQMIQAISNQTDTSAQFENQFDKAWPDLAENKDMVMRVGAVYRQMNPKASAEQFINDVGAQVMVAVGKQGMQTPAVAEVQSPQNLAPHTPAGVGGAAKVTPKATTNEFSLMSEELDD